MIDCRGAGSERYATIAGVIYRAYSQNSRLNSR